MHPKQNPFLIGFLFCFLLKASVSLAQGIPFSMTNDEIRSKIQITGGFTQLQDGTKNEEGVRVGKNLGGILGSVGFTYAFNSMFGFGATFEQAFQTGLTPLYSMIEVAASIPFIGSLYSSKLGVVSAGRPVLIAKSFSPFVLRSEIFVTQYFLNSGKQVIGLAGGGVGLIFDWHLAETWGIGIFAKYSKVSNPTLPATTIKFGTSLLLTL